jgi:hypothetical protein
MSSSPSRRRHPLTAAGTALEHLFLRHFGFHLAQEQSAEKASSRACRRPARTSGR